MSTSFSARTRQGERADATAAWSALGDVVFTSAVVVNGTPSSTDPMDPSAGSTGSEVTPSWMTMAGSGVR